jgi:hypothetical protein
MFVALFSVDLADDVRSRPGDLDPPVCASEVVDAMNDYTGARGRIQQAAVLHDDHQLASAIAALTNPPTIPPTPRSSIEVVLLPSK